MFSVLLFLGHLKFRDGGRRRWQKFDDICFMSRQAAGKERNKQETEEDFVSNSFLALNWGICTVTSYNSKKLLILHWKIPEILSISITRGRTLNKKKLKKESHKLLKCQFIFARTCSDHELKSQRGRALSPTYYERGSRPGGHANRGERERVENFFVDDAPIEILLTPVHLSKKNRQILQTSSRTFSNCAQVYAYYINSSQSYSDIHVILMTNFINIHSRIKKKCKRLIIFSSNCY